MEKNKKLRYANHPSRAVLKTSNERTTGDRITFLRGWALPSSSSLSWLPLILARWLFGYHSSIVVPLVHKCSANDHGRLHPATEGCCARLHDRGCAPCSAVSLGRVFGLLEERVG